MSAASQQRAVAGPTGLPRSAPPRLQLVPTPRVAPPSRSDTAYAGFLAFVLVVGVLGVLLLNTSMQQQAERIAAVRARISALHLQEQALRTALDRTADPAVLARWAHRLGMRPVTRLRFLGLSAPRPAAGRGRAG